MEPRGRREADCALVLEKDQGGIGKDMRVWRIAIRDGRFEMIDRPSH